MGNPSTGWYETFFRNYDPALGRFTGIDPLATKFASLSGYHYSFNNPVMYNDPTGAEGEPGNPWFSWNWYWGSTIGSGRHGFGEASQSGSALDQIWNDYVGFADKMMYEQDLKMQARNGYRGAIREMAALKGGSITTYRPYGTYASMNGKEIEGSRKVDGFYREEGQAQNGRAVVQASLLSDVFDKGNPALNAGGTLVGAGELGLHYLRNYKSGSGPKEVARIISKFTDQRVGTQQVANVLKGYSNSAKAIGSKLGAAGAILSTVDYFANFEDKNGYEHASYYLGLAAYGLAFVNPIGAGIAVGYGIGQLGSYLYNGKTLEENVGTSLGF